MSEAKVVRSRNVYLNTLSSGVRALKDASALAGMGYMAFKKGRQAFSKKKGMPKPQVKAVVSRNETGTTRRIKKTVQRKKPQTSVKTLAKSVKALQHEANSDIAHAVYRQRDTGRIIAGVKQQTLGATGYVHHGYYETAMANLKYYDPATPGTLVTAAGATGTVGTNSYTRIPLIAFRLAFKPFLTSLGIIT